MPKILELRNPIQYYAWGSRTAIPELLGRSSPADEPEAELWMGSHPKAPSEARRNGSWASLRDLIAEAPAEILGTERADRGVTELPFLFKVLAAGEPLSIQAHPDAEQARHGFENEEALGIPRDADHRNYRDRHPKPEILYALTPFSIVRGFRQPGEIRDLLEQVDLPRHLPACRKLDAADDKHALEQFFRAYMSLGDDQLEQFLPGVVERCRSNSDHEAFAWVAKLSESYPGDRGVLAPLFLHVRTLAPGEAMYTGPGVLHAYLDGVGMELMVSSDNVLRGGLTTKHVDVPELLHVLRFEPLSPTPLAATPVDGGRRFEAGGLTLDVLDLRDGEVSRLPAGRVTILMCTAGRGTLHGSETVSFARGESFLIPAAASEIRIDGDATVFVARG